MLTQDQKNTIALVASAISAACVQANNTDCANDLVSNLNAFKSHGIAPEFVEEIRDQLECAIPDERGP